MITITGIVSTIIPADAVEEPMAKDSLLVVVDGIPYNILIENKQLPPLELLVNSFPVFSPEDVESVDLITSDELLKVSVFHNLKSGLLLIKTNEESAIKEFSLNGKPVHKKKGIALGYLLDQRALFQQIEKQWNIKPKRIRSLKVNGKSIDITTK